MPLFLFFFLQGLSLFLAETVWIKLGIIFWGGTYRVPAWALFSIFSGMGLGSYYWGRKNINNFPLGFFLPASLLLWPLSYGLFRAPWGGLIPSAAGISAVCFMAGGYFPLAASRVEKKSLLGLYAVHGAGAVVGILAAIFFLFPRAGFAAALALAGGISTASLFLWRFIPIKAPAGMGRPADEPVLPWKFLAAVFTSGFLSLLLEVAGIRQIAAGTDNSVFAFGSATLIILFFVFAAAAVVARLPARWTGAGAVAGMALLSAAGVLVSSRVFVGITGGLATRVADHSTGFLESFVFSLQFLPLATTLPCFLFPMILRTAAGGGELRGRVAGALFAFNAAGCALGALLGGTLFPPLLGLWGMVGVVALGYGGLALLFAPGWRGKALAVAGFGPLLFFSPFEYPVITADPLTAHFDAPGQVLWEKEGGYGAVSVVRFGEQRTLWLNSSYVLGGSRSLADDRRLGLLPALLAPAAKNAALIGLATGITASGLLEAPLQHALLIELVPEVREAAERFFDEANRRCLSDPRVTVVVADGRHYFSGSGERFDLVVSDLFVPWHENTSFLYTREHFQNVKARLSPEGLFFLWLPAYELTEEEFWIIARTFSEVFSGASLWQNGFSAAAPVLGLAGGKIPWKAVDSVAAGREGASGADFVEKHRAGRYSRFIAPLENAAIPSKTPVNTLNHPVLEYLSAGRERSMLTGERFLDFLRRTQRPAPSFSDSAAGFQKAGWYMANSVFELRRGNREEAYRYFDLYKALMPEVLRQP